MTIDRKLLEFLVCPQTKSSLRFDASTQELISDKAKLAYKIDNNIPIMMPETARTLEKTEIKK